MEVLAEWTMTTVTAAEARKTGASVGAARNRKRM